MRLDRHHLDDAVQAGILQREQADALDAFLRSRPDAGPRFDFTHVLYYLGGLIAIGAMSVFMTLGWEAFGGWGILAAALAYAAAGLWLCERFRRRGHAIPAGICATFAVALTPLAIYGLQQGMGWWPDDSSHYRDYHTYIRWHWLYLELGTLAAGTALAWRYRYPFMLMPVAVTLWYLSMDLTAMLIGQGGDWDWQLRALVSMYFGLLVVLLAFWVDLRSRGGPDFAFWLYLFGVLAFWGGLSSQHSDSELGKLLYCGINLLLIATGAVLVRRVFVVFGAIGVCMYLGHLAREVFRDSWLFPISLTAIGLGIVWLGLLWQRHEAAITRRLRARLPPPLQELLSGRQGR